MPLISQVSFFQTRRLFPQSLQGRMFRHSRVLTAPAHPGKAPAGNLSHEPDPCWEGYGMGSPAQGCCSPVRNPPHPIRSPGGMAWPGPGELGEDELRSHLGMDNQHSWQCPPSAAQFHPHSLSMQEISQKALPGQPCCWSPDFRRN